MDNETAALLAVNHLSYVLVGIELLPIFQHFFPREYARRRINFGAIGSVYQALHSFTHLVNERLFPVQPLCELEYDEIEYAAEQVPMLPARFAICDRKYESEYTPLEKLLTRDEMSEGLDVEALRAFCEEQRGPLKSLGLARDILCGATRNVWIDIDEETLWQAGENPDWTIENVEWLAAEYKEAKVMMKKLKRFEAWVQARPARLKQIEKMLHQCKRKPRVRVRTSGRPLIEVLT